MALDFNIKFQDRLGVAIATSSFSQLNSLAEECKKNIAYAESEEKILFFKEALKLISLTQFAWQGKVHETQPLTLSALNKNVITFIDHKIDQTITDIATQALKKEICQTSAGLEKALETLEKSLDQAVEDIAKLRQQRTAKAFFIEERIVADGDCGFHALDITRKGAVKYLKSLSQNAAARAIAAPEIRGYLLTELKEVLDEKRDVEFSAALRIKMARYSLLAAGSAEAEVLLNEIAHEKEIFEAYVADYYDKKKGYLVIPDPGTTGILNILADWKKVNVYIWEKNKDNDLYLHNITKPSQRSGEKNYHLYHRAMHFNRLRPAKENVDFKLKDIRSFIAL